LKNVEDKAEMLYFQRFFKFWAQKTRRYAFMAFFNSAVTVLQTVVVARGAGLGIWGAINLLEVKITGCFAAPVRPQGSIVPDVRDAAFR